MRNLSLGDSRDPGGSFRASPRSTPDSLQMSYCLVSEEEMESSVDPGPQTRRHISPNRSKRSPTIPHSKSPSSSKHGGEESPAEPPSSAPSPDGNVLRRESTQTVRPGDLGSAQPQSPTRRRESSLSPSAADDSFGMSDISCSASRHDSPVASFSEYPLSRLPSVHDNQNTNDAPGHYPDHSEQELVMPVLTVPHRRPFTETGKSIGSLKILVAGGRGKPACTTLWV